MDTYALQLDQGLRNAVQGEFGRALAVTKLQSIKETVNTLAQNFKKEGQAISSEVDAMLKKNQPTEIEATTVENLSRKTQKVVASIPKINELEKVLEV